MKKWTPLFLLCLVIVLGGCGKDGSLTNPFAEDTSTPPPPNFVAEFPDIPIPREMSEPIVSSNTFVTFTPSGAKCGVQKFSGRFHSGPRADFHIHVPIDRGNVHPLIFQGLARLRRQCLNKAKQRLRP